MESDYSSPPHTAIFNSSPCKNLQKMMSLTRNHDDLDDADAISRPTSISSDNEGSQDGTVNEKILSKGQKVILLTDEDSGSEEKASSESEEEDGISFLNRFRQRQAISERINGSFDSQPSHSSSNQSGSHSYAIDDTHKLIPHANNSSIFSGSLTELSSSQHANSSDHDRNRASSSTVKLHHLRRPESPLASSSDSVFDRKEQSALREEELYMTEAEKRAEQDHKRTERKSAMERLAAKSRKEDENNINRESSTPTEDQITSNSEKDTSSDRTKLKQRKKSKKVGDRAAARTLNLAPEVDIATYLSSEDDEDVRPSTSAAEKHVRPLSKKDLDEMNRVQARIDREKRISSARIRQAPRERKRFDIHDLLAKIGNSEADRKQALPLTKLERALSPRQSCQSPSSDPIEAFSDNDEVDVDPKLMPGRSSTRPFYAQIQDRLLSKAPGLDDDDIDLFDSENLIEKALRQSEERDRWRKWQERKQAVLKEAITNGKGTEKDGDDDIELYRDADVKSASTKTSHSPHSRHTGRQNLGPSDGPRQMLSGLDVEQIKEDVPEMTISTQQIQRFGRLIGMKGQQEKPKDASIIAKNIEQVSNVPKPAVKKKDQFKGTKTVDLQAYIMHKMERQNIELRKGKSLKTKVADDYNDTGGSEKQDITTLIESLRRDAHNEHTDRPGEEISGDEDDSEYTPEDDDQEQNVEHDYGSGNESVEMASSVENVDVIKARINTDDEQLFSSDSGEEDQEAVYIQPRDSQKSKQRNRTIIDEDDNGDNYDVSAPEDEPLPASKSSQSNRDGNADAKQATEEGMVQLIPSTNKNAGHEKRSADPNPSAVFGQFFEDTQSDAPLQNDSFKVLSTKEHDNAGFTQFFEQGTPMTASSRSGMMLPPTTSARGFLLHQASEQDEFAALRRAQASQAKLIDDDPFDLPELDDVLLPEQQDENLALELEAMRAEEEERLIRLKSTNRSENEITYINKEGFFTQTRPQSFSYQLSQMQTQVEGSTRDANHSFEQNEDQMSNDDEEDAVLGSKMRRRYRRAVLAHEEEDQVQSMNNDVQYDGIKEVEQETARERHSAFDVLREGARKITKKDEDKAKMKFIQGEAEESDGDSGDEEGMDLKKGKGKNKGRHGGLEGVFSDQDDQDSSEEEEEDDGRDLEDLIDEQRDEEEAEKDILARERYLKDVDEDEKAALALHERATRGAFRNKRRARNHESGNLEGFLEDDYEDDWLQKLAKNPYGSIAKKRRLEGKDGMDLLAEKEDSQAFVREYHDSHGDSQPLDAYSFLMHVDEDGSDEDETGLPNQEAFISRKDVADAIAEKRKAKRMEARRLHALDDEIEIEERRKKQEEEEIRERQLRRNIERALYNASDDEDEEFIRDQGNSDLAIFSTQMNARSSHIVVAEQDQEKEEAIQSSLSSVLPGVASRSIISDRERARLAKLAKDFENEPDWQSAKEAIQRVRGRPSNKNESSGSRSVGQSLDNSKQTNSTPLSSSVRTRLQGVMSRENLFS